MIYHKASGPAIFSNHILMKAKKEIPKTVTKQVAYEPLVKSTNLFPVVGIGASAGGLDAFKKLLKAIPEDSGMAYVLVQHLDPKHESMLPELLQKVTNIPVLEIADDGIGLSGEVPPAGGQGVRNMKARAESIGGRIHVTGQPSCGTLVQLIFPLRN